MIEALHTSLGWLIYVRETYKQVPKLIPKKDRDVNELADYAHFLDRRKLKGRMILGTYFKTLVEFVVQQEYGRTQHVSYKKNSTRICIFIIAP